MKKKNFIASEHSTSPINIAGGPNSDGANIHFNYPESMLFDLAITSTINGSVLTASVSQLNEEKAFVAINNETYELRQLHVHAPSEHTIDNLRHTLEWHFVHQTEDGHYTVIGVFMEKDNSTTAPYQTLFDVLATSNEGSCTLAPRTLIPEKTTGWHYNGTLTTPPYDPVQWVVMQTITTIAESDLQLLLQAMGQA
ncbi:MAG: carbonic anhydrase [Candidatus Dependentiae bacterium]|nr:carbonic anhydrase [Candidatus Dependentiae bacterium]